MQWSIENGDGTDDVALKEELKSGHSDEKTLRVGEFMCSRGSLGENAFIDGFEERKKVRFNEGLGSG